MLQTVDDSHSNKNKNKPTVGVFNRIKLAIASKKKVSATIMPLVDEPQVLAKENIPAHPNDQVQVAHCMQMVENLKNQLNQKTTVIKKMQTITISNSDGVHIGNVYDSGSSRTLKRKKSRKNIPKQSTMSETNEGTGFPLFI